MTDVFSKAERSAIMARVRASRNLSTEIVLIQALRQQQVRGWRRGFPLAGKPDLVFPKNRVAVFLDGCFWHGCPRCYRRPKSRRRYWDAKVARNKTRDRAVTRALRRQQWRVLRIWEHELTRSPTRCALKIKKELDQ